MRAPLRVNILINRPGWSGGARVLARHARLLRDAGATVTLVSATPPPLSLGKRVRTFLSPPASPAGPQSHFEAEGLSVRRSSAPDTISAADVPDGDIVIASFWRAAEWMLALPPEKGRRVYLVQHHEADFPHADRGRAAATYRGNAAIFTVSRWLQDVMRDQYGRNDAVLTPNAVDTALFRPGGVRRRNERPTIGFLASSNPTKRIDVAVGACEILKAALPDLRVVVLASKREMTAAMPPWFERRVNPAQESIPDVYRSCDFWLFTSAIEGYGLPLLEAMACGTPAIASPAGAAPDLIDATNGALVARLDPSAFAGAAADLFAQPSSSWERMSALAAETAQRHDWPSSFAVFHQALRAVASAPRDPARATPADVIPAAPSTRRTDAPRPLN